MTKQKRNMERLSYGIRKPSDLLKKLRWNADKLTRSPHPYDIFDFMLTAAVLAEWIEQFYSAQSVMKQFSAPGRSCKAWILPDISSQWIDNTSCLPNPHCDLKRHIANALSICIHTANASKHFHWKDHGDITSIGHDPPIGGWYQWFFTSTVPDLYIEFQGENYGLQQIKDILLQFYTGLIEYFDGLYAESLIDT